MIAQSARRAETPSPDTAPEEAAIARLRIEAPPLEPDLALADRDLLPFLTLGAIFAVAGLAYLTGAPLFVSLALLVIGAKGELSAFRETCAAGMKTIPAYIGFLVTCYWAIGRFDFITAVAAGIFVWLAVALLIFVGAGLLAGAR